MLQKLKTTHKITFNMNKEQQLNEEALNTEINDSEKTATEELAEGNEVLEELVGEPTVEDLLNTANEKISELNDKYLRQAAEFDNYRKRVIKEKAELIKSGGEKLMVALLPVLDDFERAQESISKAQDVEALKEGVNLIVEKFIKVLKQEGLEKMDVVGKDFDTDYHEAIAMVPGQPDEMKGKIIDCIMAGYTLNEKVVRHAKVAVGQ